jgi:hypothetical protein
METMIKFVQDFKEVNNYVMPPETGQEKELTQKLIN